MRNLASIQKIVDIRLIPECDNIEIAKINNWNVVVKKDEFNIGDLVIYLEIDSIIPESMHNIVPFMESSKWRVKTKKIRGVYSQGLILNKNILTESQYDLGYLIYELEENYDLTDILGITKYEIPDNLSIGGQAAGKWISEDLPKTDENRIQKLSDNFFELLKQSCNDWIASYKVDGSSLTCAIIDNEFRIGSHNLELKFNEYNITNNAFCNIVNKHNIMTKMFSIKEKYKLNNFAIQGELCGPGIQQNKQKFPEKTIRWFYIFNIDTQEYLNQEIFENIILDMQEKSVPIIPEFSLNNYNSCQDLIDYVTTLNYPEFNSKNEGIVIFPKNNNIDDMIIQHELGRRCSFKVINNKYLV